MEDTSEGCFWVLETVENDLIGNAYDQYVIAYLKEINLSIVDVYVFKDFCEF